MNLYSPPQPPFHPQMTDEVESDSYALFCPECKRVVISNDCEIGGTTTLDKYDSESMDESFMRDFRDFGDHDRLMFCPACTGWLHMDRDRLPTATRVSASGGQKELF
jgi:hypothetical protein